MGIGKCSLVGGIWQGWLLQRVSRETRISCGGETKRYGWDSRGRQGPLLAKEGHDRLAEAGENVVGMVGAEHDPGVA